MLVQLLYASRPDPAISAEQMDEILLESRRNNPPLGITGILCYTSDTFMQVLEGGRGPVNEVYNRIARDPRHRQIELLHYAEITERMFGNWTMGQVNLAKINPAMVLRYSEAPTLDPYKVSGRVSMALLQELIASAAIVGRT